MGVTLERVQNKFACIIGELCSEPDILSQFAIWVDLRIAEYKAKGAISLECSGEEPDPVWLKGHKPKQPSVKREITPPRYHDRGMGDNSINRQHSDTLSHSNINHSEKTAARLSPDIVVIKEEPVDAGDGVFPISLHLHDSSTSNRNTPRKRTSAETIGQSDPGSSTSTSKIRRLLSSPSPALLVEPVNQSLMSIISEGALNESADNSANFSLDYSGLDPNTEDNSSSVFQSEPVPSTSSAESGDQQDNNSTVTRLENKTQQYVTAVDTKTAQNMLFSPYTLTGNDIIFSQPCQQEFAALQSDSNLESHENADNNVQNPCHHCFDKDVEIGSLKQKLCTSQHLRKSASYEPAVYLPRPKPGKVPPAVAAENKMVELLEGRGIFVYPDQKTSLLTFRKKKNSGQAIARRAMTLLFRAEELLRGTLSPVSTAGLQPLNPDTIEVICDFSALHGSNTKGQIRNAMWGKLTAMRAKAKDPRRYRKIQLHV